ncbi:MAG: transposase [Nitrososphaerales archaeon]
MCDAVILDPMKRMVSKAVKRDWQVYDIYRKDEEALFLEKAEELIWSLPPPYEEKQTGRPLYNPRSMAMIALLKMKFKKDYRSLESHLRARRDLLGIIGLDEAPSKSSIHLSLKRMPEPYLKKLNSILTQPFKGGA